nr:hypothetical protein [Tanacetum cinerariifolium]
MKVVTTRSGLAYEEPDVPRTQPKPSISYPSSFADALLLMPKFASTIKCLLANKDKLFELAKVSLNENCSAMLLKKLLEKLGDPGKFLIPYDFPGMEICHALANLGASIHLMPLSIWKKLSLPELTPTRMTLKLADRSITRPKGVPEDVFVKVGKFPFPTDFIVVDFEADPRVPLILGRYSSTYNDTSVNRVDVIDVTCEEFMQDVLDFQYNSKSSNPTLVSDDSISENDSCKVHIVKSSSLTLTPFRESDFILEEIEDFLNDDSIPDEIDDSVFDPEGDIRLIEKLLNADPCSLPLMDIKLAEESKEKSSVKEPPELELKDFPSHLEYAFLEDSNKLPGIDPRFCTHKILIEDDYKPAVQSQRRVNPKIHDVIKKEVIKLLDAGMIYPISDSPWDFSKIARPMTHLLEKETLFIFSMKCIDAFNTLKKKLTEASILVVPDWNLPFELMCDDAKPRLLRWVLLLQEFDITILDKKGSENLTADHLSRLENPHQEVLENKDINENFPLETLGSLTSHNTPWKLLKSSKLSMRDLPEAIMVPISQRRSDRGTHFCNDQFTRVMIKYGVTHRLATAYHPQTSGQVEDYPRRLKLSCVGIFVRFLRSSYSFIDSNLG